MKIDHNPQGSDGWKRARLGILTASDFDRLITRKTRKPSAGIAGLIEEKAAEWAIGEPLDDFSSGMTDRGNELEEEAAARYALETDTNPEKVGLCLMDDLPIGASPDRLVGDDGLLEIKCPGPKAMVAYLLNREALVDEYRCQVQGQLWVTGRAWCDLYPYNEMFPSLRVRCPRDEEFIAALAEAAGMAAQALSDAKERLTALGCVPPEPDADDLPPEDDLAPPPPLPIVPLPALSCLTHADQTCPDECSGRFSF